MKNIRNLILITLITILIILSLFVLKNVGIYADGSLHLSISNFITKNNSIPETDFNGQINSNFRQPLSYNIPNIYTPPVYILISGYSQISGITTKQALDYISILSIITAGLMLISITKKYTNNFCALYSGIFFFLLSSRYRNLGHRLLENHVILISLCTLFFSININKFKLGFIGFGFFLTFLFFSKQANLFFCIFISIITIIISGITKSFIKGIALSIIIFIPCFLWILEMRGTIIPTPPPVGENSPTEIIFPNPRWKKEIRKEREAELDLLVNINNIRKTTFNQFESFVQDSIFINIKKGEFYKIIQKYFPLNITEKFVPGYNAPINNYNIIHKLNIFFLILGFISLIAKKDKYNKYIKTILLLTIIVTLFYTKFVMFRYYIIISILTIPIFGLGLEGIFKRSKILGLLGLTFFIILQLPILSSEAQRNIKYENSINHKFTNNSGGLKEINELKKVNGIMNGIVFTPIIEIPYYINVKIYRDEKYFFIKERDDLIYYLDKAGIKYVINPFYSNTIPRSKRRYYNGIPSDSTFGKMLKKQDCFKLVSNQLSFDVYEITPDCLKKK